MTHQNTLKSCDFPFLGLLREKMPCSLRELQQSTKKKVRARNGLQVPPLDAASSCKKMLKLSEAIAAERLVE